ncbi:MAG: FAD-binding dehydrogenase [Saprospiraceae bacterium]|nr:FAD-binding dehydrogenase [Saprospiraceae bacterium]
MIMKYQSDVLIVGGGLAGIIAAYELLDSGKKIIIVDRDTEENFGGLARWAFGGMLFVDTPHQRRMGIRDSYEIARQDWFSFAEFDREEYWGKKWAEQYLQLCTDHGYRYLRKHNINFFPILNFPERGLHVPGNSLPRFHMVWGTGWGLVNEFIKRLRNHPKRDHLQLIFNHRVLDILVENNSIKGVSGKREDNAQPFEMLADQVVIATGGINGSIERVRANWYKPWGEPPATILNGAHYYAIGDLHDATTRVKGNVVNLDKQWNYAVGIRHYEPRVKDHGLSLVPMKSTLWVNYEGKRFGPMPLVTPYDTRFLVERICQEPVKYSWQILNAKIAYKEFSISGSEHNAAMRDKKFLKFIIGMLIKGGKELVDKIANNCEDVIMADSLDDLVAKMNALTGDNYVKKENVENAAKKYDAEIDRGVKYFQDEQLIRLAQLRRYIGDRVRTCKFQKILDPDAGPLIAIRSFILSRKSMGGIQTNLQSKVLTIPDHRGNQTAVDGLYAVGEAAGFGGGGIHGYRSLEGTFLGGCVINARVAAADILGKSLT